MNMVVIIPALNPDENLIGYVQALKKSINAKILIVDDGSSKDKKYIFNDLKNDYECILLEHAVNLGKGCSLKNAFNYCLVNFANDDTGVITVDSDGQHSIEDVIKIKEALEKNPDGLILGARNFDSKTPFKSQFGNKLTKNILTLLWGGKISDTQTGLRAISLKLLPQFLILKGERFEYETAMLIEALQKKIPIKEVQIKTIYFDGNKSTHFRAVADSIKIYRVIFSTFIKFSFSSMFSTLIDLGIFQLFVMTLNSLGLCTQVFIATVFARIISSLYNYLINKTYVFQGKQKINDTFIKYYLLCVSIMCLSALSVYTVVSMFDFPKVIVKGFVDSILFFLSFKIQSIWVFREDKNKKCI